MRQITGTIISLKTPNTAKVDVVRLWQHPLYQKSVKRTKSFACHYQDMELQEGDTVIIQQTTPKSKTKRFEVVKKV